MKNEIGRKLTSLTIMAIMFAGGMAIGVPSFMPEAASDLSSTSGLLTVSSTTIQGAAILEIVVNDPDYSDTTVDISATPTVEFGGQDYNLNQATNGKWYVYIVDNSVSSLFDVDTNGQEFGIKCLSGIAIDESSTNLIEAAATGNLIGIWASAIHTGNTSVSAQSGVDGSCHDLDGMYGVLDTATSTGRSDLTASVLAGAPSLSNHNDDVSGATGIDMGQRGHSLNGTSGMGSWPYILAIEFTDDNVVSYGGDSISVTYGNTDSDTSIELANRNPGERSEVHLTFTDPGMNIDPTSSDIWIFDLSDTAATPNVIFGNNGTNNTMSAAELGQMGCVDNCRLTSDGEGVLAAGGGNGVDAVVMTETGSNTGVFESFDVNGGAEFETSAQAAADSKIVFSYGGNSVDMIITYNDATITLDAGGDWAPGQSATVIVNDPDQNKKPNLSRNAVRW